MKAESSLARNTAAPVISRESIAHQRPRRDRDVARILVEVRVPLHRLCNGVASRDCVDENVVATQLVRQRARHTNDRTLACDVGHQHWRALDRGSRSEIDDAAEALRAHVRRNRLRRSPRRQRRCQRRCSRQGRRTRLPPPRPPRISAIATRAPSFSNRPAKA